MCESSAKVVLEIREDRQSETPFLLHYKRTTQRGVSRVRSVTTVHVRIFSVLRLKYLSVFLWNEMCHQKLSIPVNE